MPRYRIRNIASALDFGAVVGGNDVTIENSASEVWNGTDDLTIFLRFKPHNNPTSTSYAFSIPATAGNNRRYIRYSPDGKLNVAVGELTLIEAVGKIKVGEWQSVALVTDVANSRWRVYYNGVLAKDWTAFTPGTGTADITIGNNTATSEFSSTALQSEVRLWNRALTADEISAVEFHNTVPSNGLVGEWLLNEGSGTTALDNSGRGNNGVITGATYSTDTPFKSRTAVTNRFTQRAIPFSLNLNGTNAYVSRNAANVYGASGYSVAFWVKATRQTDARTYGEGSSASDTPTFFLGSSNVAATNDRLAVFLRNDAVVTKLNFVTSTTPVYNGLWNHVVWTDSNGTCALYVNGVADSTNFNYSQSGTYTLNRTSFGALVRTSVSSYVKGSVCELKTYTTALSSTQVAQLYRTGSVGAPNLIWLLNEGSGTTATDTSGNGSDGTITNGSYVTDSPRKARSATTSRNLI